MTETNGSKRIGGVIVSHGSVANELLNAAKNVIGDVEHLRAVSIGWDDDVEDAKGQISAAINAVDDGSGVLLATDMFGGTPTNIAAMFLDSDSVEIVTGVNLPMVLKLAAGNSGIPLLDLAKEIEDQGKDSICRASTLLGRRSAKKDG